MKKLLLIALSLVSILVVAQPPEEEMPESRREEMEAMKVAYITKKLNLTTEESQKFWPVYNEFQAEIDAERKKGRPDKAGREEDIEGLSDAEVDKMIKDRFAHQRKMVEIEEKYYEKFKTILSVKKVAEYYKAEMDFRRELLRTLRDRRGEGGARRRP